MKNCRRQVAIDNDGFRDDENDPQLESTAMNDVDSNGLTSLSGKALEVSLSIEIPNSFEKANRINISGPCNGIYCVWTKNGITLWNPALRELRVLPKHANPFQAFVRSSCAFGFDCLSDDYKVIRKLFPKRGGPGTATGTRMFEVYSLNTDSWKIVNVYEDSYVYLEDRCLNLNGIIYWAAYKEKRKVFFLKSVFAFNLGNEEYFEIPPPVFDKKMTFDVSVLNELIALIAFRFDVRSTSQCFDVWVMSESYGSNGNNGDFWTLLLRLEPHIPEVLSPLGFQRNGELILFNDQKIIMFNPNSQGIKRIPIPRSVQVLFHEESLISIKGKDVHPPKEGGSLHTKIASILLLDLVKTLSSGSVRGCVFPMMKKHFITMRNRGQKQFSGFNATE
ncbi:hypothetical protein RJ641_036541 [Dillenia turbinata]|uniref:F-box associated beta-propeller type 1 domain-containing protein n=1 Tax=Dillenia turbinata TaxID=194707 RepID=A0AAN8ZDC3_9MAGN